VNLGAVDREIVLVLDDCHAIDARGVQDGMAAGELATAPGWSGRSECGPAHHHRRAARRGLQRDVPAQAKPDAGHQRTAAGLLDVLVPPRAPPHPRDGTHRSPLLITAVFATLFGGIAQYSHWAALAALPVAAWELSLGVWLIVKGFRPSPITTGMAAATTPAARQDVTV
jgi:hypothetical protein